MIGTVQRKRLVQSALLDFLRSGRVPSVKKLISEVTRRLQGRSTGLPLFIPTLVGPTSIIEPKTLKGNLEAVVEDLETLNEGLGSAATTFSQTDTAMALKVGALHRRLHSASSTISSRLLSALSLGVSVVDDDLKTSDNVDVTRTTAFVDYANGQAMLPPSTSESGLHLMLGAKIVEETGKAKPLVSFSTVYDGTGKSWYAEFGEKSSYSATINLTGKPVIAGHANEIQANSIEIEALSDVTVGLDLSTDGMNWVQVVPSTQISGRRRYNFEPTWSLFLRVRLEGSGAVGIRSLYVHKLICSESAVFQTKLIQPAGAYYSLAFTPQVILPNGASIEHYLVDGSSPDGPGTAINPGVVSLYSKIQVTSTPAASDFTVDSIPNLYTQAISTGSYIPIVESAELYRGYQQFKVEVLDYSWLKQGDEFHIPQLSDWSTMGGTPQVGVMSQSGVVGSGATLVTSGQTTSGTLLGSYTTTETWTTMALSSGSVLLVRPNYNYKLTTKVYLDRDIVIENGAASILALGTYATNPTSIGWALYVNGNRLAADNTVYGLAAVPSTGSLGAAEGRNFQLALVKGWNTVEILLSVPDGLVVADLSSFQVAFFLRPDIFSLQLPTVSLGTSDAPMSSYPIWAESAPLRRVSEFYLKGVVSPWDRGSWALRLYEGEPTHIILNYDPDNSLTLDGRNRGSVPNFYLKYFVDYGTPSGFYYRAVLRRSSSINTTPSLLGYQFATTRE